jgi:hypothetical protein
VPKPSGEALETLEPEPVGVGVFELEDGSGLWEVGAYFTETPDDIALSLLAAAHGAQPFAVSELPKPTGSPMSGGSFTRSGGAVLSLRVP